MPAKKLRERFFAHLYLAHVQLDECLALPNKVPISNTALSGNGALDCNTNEVGDDANTRLLPILQLGPRTQKMAYSVVYELKHRLADGCVPIFCTDGLKFYLYALIAHFGKWLSTDPNKPVWVLFHDFLYAQVIKHQRRSKTVAVERKILVGEESHYQQRLKQVSLNRLINTACVERLNLTIRQSVSTLTRRNWGLHKHIFNDSPPAGVISPSGLSKMVGPHH